MKKLIILILAALLLTTCSKLNSKVYEKLRLKHSYKEITFNKFLEYSFWDWPKPFHIVDLNYPIDSNYMNQTLRYLLQPSSLSMEGRLYSEIKNYEQHINYENIKPLNRTYVFLNISGTSYAVRTEGGGVRRFSFRYIPIVDTFEILLKNPLRDEMMWGKESRAIFFNSINSKLTLKHWFFTDSVFNAIKYLDFKAIHPFLSEWRVERKMDYPANKKQEDGLIYKYRYKVEKFPDSLTYPDTSVVYMGISDNIFNKCSKYPNRKLELRFKEFSPDGIIDLNPETDKYEISIRSLWYIYIGFTEKVLLHDTKMCVFS